MKYSCRFLIPALLILLTGCQQNKTSKQEDISSQAIPVVIEKAGITPANTSLSVSGNVESRVQVKLSFMASGRINYIASETGQRIGKGALVASLDPSSYQIAKEASAIQVQQAADQYERLKVMHDRGSLSESDFRQAGLQLEQARNQQRLQAQNLAYTRLYSGINGILLSKLSSEGEIVSTGTPVLVIADISTVKVNASVPEDELKDIRIGQAATVQISSLDSVFSGKVTEVGYAAEASSRTFSVKIELPNPRLLIRPGMVAEISLPTNRTKNMLTVPAETIVHDANDENFVFVVDTTKNKAFKRKVTLGQLANTRIEVTSGINSGEFIVTGGQQRLTDGSPISISQ